MKIFRDFFDKELNLGDLIKDKAGRLRLEKFTYYALGVLLLLPFFSSLIIPFSCSLTIDPYKDLLTRSVTSLATGGVVVICAIILFLIVGKSPQIQRGYVFLIFPVSMMSLVMQLVMYKEFGVEINYRVLALFKEDLKPLWAIASNDYHVHWWSLLVLIFSFYVTKWVFTQRALSMPFNKKTGIILCVLFIGFGVMATALKLRVNRLSYFDSGKTARAPIFQLGEVLADLVLGAETGYESILSRVATYDDPIKSVIRKRLGSEIEGFTSRSSKQPVWLKKKPSHVFLFLMESMESRLIDDSAIRPLAPNLNKYAREGVYLERFISAGHSTIEAVHSMLAGSAPIHRYPRNDYPLPIVAKMYKMDTLPKIMHQSGYKPLFLAASFRKFRLKGDVAEAYGYDRFIGCPDVAEDIPVNEWGVNDGDFFQWSKSITHDLTEPHFITFLNVSNHDPFDAPIENLHDEDIFNSKTSGFFEGTSLETKLYYAKHIFYADLQIGNAVSDLKDKYPDALFVFVGDHCARKVRKPSSRVPFIMWNDRIVDKDVDTSHWYGTHMDILATLAETLLSNGSKYQAMGQPFWSDDLTRVSIGSDRLLCSKGIYKFGDDSPEEIFPGNKPPSKEAGDNWDLGRLRLKASAIEALSWGALHSVSLPER